MTMRVLRAGAGAGAAAGRPKRGWFGRNKNNAGAAPGTPQQSYAAQPFNANQGPAGANRDVEMGNTGLSSFPRALCRSLHAHVPFQSCLVVKRLSRSRLFRAVTRLHWS